MRLTGRETPRDLEFLHYLATAGEIDNTIARIKFGTACGAAMKYLMALGHPIVPVKNGTQIRRDATRWLWAGEETP